MQADPMPSLAPPPQGLAVQAAPVPGVKAARLPPPAAAAWALPVLALLALAAALWAGRAFIVPIITATVLAVLLWPALKRLQGVLRSRAVAALLVVLGAGLLAATLALAVVQQLGHASDQLPSALRLLARDIAQLPTEHARSVQRTRSALQELDRSVSRVTGTAGAIAAAPAPASSSLVASVADWGTAAAIDASKAAAGTFLQAGVIALLCFFILCNGEGLAARLRSGCERAVPTPGRCQVALDECARQVRLFAGVTMVTNALFGLCVALGFWALSIPEAAMWGVAAAALHFVPYAGLAVVAVLAALEAYVVHTSVLAALLAFGFVAVLGVVVGTAVTVVLQGRAAKVDNAVLFGGTVFWSVLWGAWGLVLGPLLVVITRLVVLEARWLSAQPGGQPDSTLLAETATVAQPTPAASAAAVRPTVDTAPKPVVP